MSLDKELPGHDKKHVGLNKKLPNRNIRNVSLNKKLPNHDKKHVSLNIELPSSSIRNVKGIYGLIFGNSRVYRLRIKFINEMFTISFKWKCEK